MLQLTQSNLLEDEDAVLEKYDEAIASFKRALELNPGKAKKSGFRTASFIHLYVYVDNQDLQDMVNMLNGEEEEEE